MRPIFADPKIDLVFRRIFGTEAHKGLLIALLNDLLGLDEAHRIVDLAYLPGEQVPVIDGLKLSIVDVKCVDVRGVRYIVEMQVLNVEGFEKRLAYNTAKAYTSQLARADEYPTLNDVVTVAICDFLLFPERTAAGFVVPMVSRWHMTEEQCGARGFGQMRYVALELPKYEGGPEPVSMVERWAWFFREARRLIEVPPALVGSPIGEALEIARSWRFSQEEWDAYDRAAMAEQDARGALALAEKVGHAEGRAEGRAEGEATGKATALLLILAARGVSVSEVERARILATTDGAALDAWLQRAATAGSIAEVLG